jgi:hypothetical protein
MCYIIYNIIKSGDEKTRVLRVKRLGVKYPGAVKSKHLSENAYSDGRRINTLNSKC